MLVPGMPLSRFTILDLTRVRAGPTCVRQLADWGADVIKIEAPPDGKEGLGGERDGFDFQNLHRNKRSLTLNLKTPEAREIFYNKDFIVYFIQKILWEIKVICGHSIL